MFASSMTMVVASFAWAEDWPGWRGPRHDGTSVASSPPLRWSANFNVAWKRRTVGIGHSSPVVSGNRVYLTSCDPSREERLVLCYDRASGELLWSKTVARSPIEQMHRRNSPASSTPVTNGNLLVATFAVDRGYFAVGLDSNGQILWNRRLAPFFSAHGFHSCPILHENTVLLSGLQDSNESFVARLDIRTGEVLWLTKTETTIRSFSPPHVTRIADENIVVVSGANCTTAFELGSGRRLWRLSGPAEKTVSSIVEADHRLFVAGGREKRLFAIDLTRPDPTEPVWTSSSGIPYVSSPIVAAGSLHQLSDNGIYTRIDLLTGKTLERHRLLGPTSASPVWADNKLFLTDESGRTLVAQLSPELTVIAENTIDEPVYASLAISNQDLFIRGERHVFCIRNTKHSLAPQN